MRHAMLHVLGRQLFQPRMRFLDALPHHLHDVAGEARMSRHKVIPNRHIPSECDAVDERYRGCRVIFTIESLSDTVDVARHDEADHYLLAVWRDLHRLQTAIEKHIKGLCDLALLENGRSFSNSERGSLVDDIVELSIVHRAERRQRLDQAAVERRHEDASGCCGSVHSVGESPLQKGETGIAGSRQLAE